jgi:hypothetical protein
MAEGNPHPAPAPLIVADLCAQAAWLDAIDDDSRLRLEWAADTIRELHARLVKNAATLEKTEAEAHQMAVYIKSMMAQKGGAA